VNASRAIFEARMAAGLTQAALARRAGTSQATMSAYESGRKRPSVDTLSRILAAAGSRLVVEPDPFARNGEVLAQVLALAEALPTRHSRTLAYPRLPT
jgi:transcriptional regulator with XRE-family HTH domain